jgi:hypothetical protein
LPRGRLLAIELDRRRAAGAVPAGEVAMLARDLLAAADGDGEPEWAHLGATLLAEQALADAPPRPPAAEEQARIALAAARTLADPARAATAQLLLARARALAGDPAGAEAGIRAVFDAAGEAGGDPWLREAARRAGAALAAQTGNADWTAAYAFDGKLPTMGAVEGHLWLGLTMGDFLQAIAQCRGDGPVLAITRRGRHLVLRSPFLVGSQAVEWGWHLRHVNANGILLAIQGPTIAVLGQRREANAPAAPGGEAALAEGGLDLARLRGPQLPVLAPPVTLRDGETACVNRFLRIHR